MNAAVPEPFHDLQEGVSREIGGTFPGEDDRGEYLKDLQLVTLEEELIQKKEG